MRALPNVILIAALTVAAPFAAQDRVPASIDLPPDLERVLRDYETAFRAKDAEGLSRLFTEDGYVLAGGRPPAHGRAAIARHYVNSGGTLYLRAFAVATAGDVGYILGAYRWAEGDPDSGKFTLTLRRVDGRWLIVSDMDNSNTRR